MVPDIILITEASVGIKTETLESLICYAPDCTIFIRPNDGLDRQAGQFVQAERLKVAERSIAEWVLIMDDDDELLLQVPSCAELDETGGDVVFFPFIKNGRRIDFKGCRPYQTHGFCGVISKRDLAVEALRYTVCQRFLREDLGYFYYLAMNARTPVVSSRPLIHKNKDREPMRNPWLRNNMRREMDLFWREKVSEAQKRLRDFNADSVLYQ